MVKIVVWSGLLVAFSLQAAIPVHAAESKQNTAACETVVEIATAVAGYGIAVANRLKELGRMIATELGDKVGSKFITRYVCGTNDDKTGVASPPAHSPLIDSLASSGFGLDLKSDSALGGECLTLQCLGITSPELQRALDDFRNDVRKSSGLATPPAPSAVVPSLSPGYAGSSSSALGLTPSPAPERRQGACWPVRFYTWCPER
jgi:hypothetical protein